MTVWVSVSAHDSFRTYVSSRKRENRVNPVHRADLAEICVEAAESDTTEICAGDLIPARSMKRQTWLLKQLGQNRGKRLSRYGSVMPLQPQAPVTSWIFTVSWQKKQLESQGTILSVSTRKSQNSPTDEMLTFSSGE
jgi:hypothetical protein